MRERRKTPRLAKAYRLRLREVAFPPAAWVEATCRDVSATGLAVECALTLAPGAPVEVRLVVPRLNLYHPGFFRALENAAHQELRAVGHVVRAERRGGHTVLGIELTDMDPDDQRAFARLLTRLLEERP
ncbi:MAG: PilZ domain-containing protein [Desulfomicrobiaceae bacterium]